MSQAEPTDTDTHVDDASETSPLWKRLLYMIGFAFLGYLAFWAILLLSAVQFIYVMLNSERNDELAAFTENLLLFVGEALGFIAFIRKDRPFPFAPFPNARDRD